MRTKATLVAVSAVVILGLLMGGFACGTKAPEVGTLTVGVVAALSGPGASWGLTQERASTLAVEDINAKGGLTVQGKKYLLNVKAYDHAFDASKGLEATKRLLKVDKAAWISTHGATVTKVMVPYTEENKVLLMHSAGGGEINKFMPQRYTFRMIANTDPEAGFILWNWFTNKYPQLKNMASVNPDNSTGQSYAADLRKLAEQYKLKVIAEAFHKPGATDYYPVLTTLLASKPDMISLGGSGDVDKGLIIKQSRELGFKGPFVAGALATPLTVLNAAGKDVSDIFFIDEVNFGGPFATAEEKKFYETWQAQYGSFDTYAVGQIRGIYPVVTAIQKVNSFDADKVAEVLHTSEFTVLGRKLRWGGESQYGLPRRIPIVQMVMMRIENGQFVPLGMVELPSGY